MKYLRKHQNASVAKDSLAYIKRKKIVVTAHLRLLNNIRVLAILIALLPSISVYASDGMLDLTFDPLSSDVFGGVVNAIAIQDNGQIIVGGDFTAIGGLPRNNLARLNADGSADPTFDPNPNFPVFDIVLTEDNKILVGGQFNEIAGSQQYRLAKLNLDGSIDATFSSPIDNVNGLEGVLTMERQGSSVLFAGRFSRLNGNEYTNIARLFSSGAVDTDFTPNPVGNVLDIAIQTNGKIIVASGSNLTRFETNGDRDLDFNPNPNGVNLNSIGLQSDGKIIVLGDFSVIDQQFHSRIARLNPNGSLDPTLKPEPNGNPQKVIVLDDDSLLISGNFTMLGSTTANRVARLNPNGTIDTSFQTPLINSSVREMAIQDDGQILIGGPFFLVDGISRHRIARLDNNVPDPDPETEDQTNFIVIPLANDKTAVIPL